MRLAITGGGTGGHVYPALEVARTAADRDDEILYLGSQRGQEASLCRKFGFGFAGFPSAPMQSLKSPHAWAALVGMIRARLGAKRALAKWHPDALFSTGGYSAAPAGVKAFVAAVLGGIGNIPGAVVGGLIMGVSEVLVVWAGYAGYRDAVAFVILIVILLFRPGGLFGSPPDKV